MNQSYAIFSAIFVLCFTCASAVIIPDELPSILSVIYSNIPTLKKGTDSRLGWGFRFGDRADLQVMVELGPQSNTQPVGNQDNKNSKRNVHHNVINTLYAQQHQAQQKAPGDVISDTDGGKWLENWSKTVMGRQPVSSNQAKPGLAIGEIDAKSVIPEDWENKNLQTGKESVSQTTLKPKTTTSHKDALDNVDLEDDP